MRLRLRGPSGQSTVTMDDNATLEQLKQIIVSETGLSNFAVKYGYPPKPLSIFDQHAPSMLLSDLDIKLNGEQLLVARSETSSSHEFSDSVEKPSTEVASNPKSNTSVSRPANDAFVTKGKASIPEQQPSAPLALTRRDKSDMEPPEIFMPELGGSLVLRVMEDDNSCLFRAISSAVMSDLDAVTELRSIVAETIQADPNRFSRAVLDNKDPDQYCRWIKGSDSWGGQIELVILSQHFGVEICSIDVQSLRVDRYNEDAPLRCFVVYSGIHYDVIALSILGMRPEDDVKQFEAPIKDEVLPKAIELCRGLQEMHYFTDTAGFQIRCNDCGAMLVGEKGATEHATKTGHYNFGEAA